MQKIALMTPVKDEMDNLEAFFKAVSSQSRPIDRLIIIENDSVDGSKEYLETLSSVDNVVNLQILHMSFADKSYDLGFKYSRIIGHGLEALKQAEDYESYDFVGILDSDCFPEPEYLEKIVSFMEEDPQIGIASGWVFTHEGKRQIADPNFVRGNSRLWRRECLEQTGFPIEPSPDAITVALAHIHGWKTKTLPTARVTAREVNTRMQNYSNQGKRVYYRGHSLLYAFIRASYTAIFKGMPKLGLDFFSGYLGDFFRNRPKIKDLKVRKYYRYYLLRKRLYSAAR